MTRHRAVALLMTVVASSMSIAGCGDDADDGSGSRTTEPVRTTAEAAVPAGSFPEWSLPDDPAARTADAGLEMAVKEHLAVHRHAHLDVFVDGKAVTVPAAVGIDITDPGVRYFADNGSYGGIEECANPCISPLHTHAESGILHTESAADALLTLGQFFTEWGVALDEQCVGEFCEPATSISVYVNGDLYEGNPADIELQNQRQIAIVVGTPPAAIPDSADFTQA